MEVERARAETVARRLLASPVLRGLTPLEKEEQARMLLRRCPLPMAALMAGPSGLPRLSWERVRGLLELELRRQTDGALRPLLAEVLPADGRFGFASGLQSAPVSGERCRAELAAVLEGLLAGERTRTALVAPLAAAARALPERYLPLCFEQEQYVHFELCRVERLRLSAAQSASLVRAALLLRAAAFLHVGPPPRGPDARFAAEALAALRARLPALPPPLLRSAVMSHLPFQDTPQLAASARLTALFAAAARALGPADRCPRGARPPEASWFAVAFRNASFHGLDAKMLEEMRGIASAQGW
jgi:hypothetical protein